MSSSCLLSYVTTPRQAAYKQCNSGTLAQDLQCALAAEAGCRALQGGRLRSIRSPWRTLNPHSRV